MEFVADLEVSHGGVAAITAHIMDGILWRMLGYEWNMTNSQFITVASNFMKDTENYSMPR